jgi:hypothetical protein
MMRITSPPINPAFEARATRVREEIRGKIASGTIPKITKELWGDFKADFSAAQHERCGYCEVPVIAGQNGDVEHYRPKNELTEFGPDREHEEGREHRHLAKVRGRSPSRRWAPGYWWLAYDWNNYLLSCVVCNQIWKKNLFPIRQPPLRSGPPTEGNPGEIPLLLNPYGSRDPAAHLQFNRDGTVEPRNSSVFGRETISTCGLHRLALTSYRRPAARDTFAAVNDARFQHRNGVAPANNSGYRDLHRMGLDDAYVPGVVRAIIYQQLRPLTWSILDDLFGDERR